MERVFAAYGGLKDYRRGCQPDLLNDVGLYCWRQAVYIYTSKSMEVYRKWLAMTRPGPGERGQDNREGMIKLLGFGVVSLVLYTMLYLYADQILEFSARGGWFFILPVALALIFSFAHGAFVSAFWDKVGIKGKTTSGQRKVNGRNASN